MEGYEFEIIGWKIDGEHSLYRRMFFSVYYNTLVLFLTQRLPENSRYTEIYSIKS